MPAKKILSLFFIISTSLLFADPLNDGIELGTSNSGAYGARSIFSNPSALAFQTELNGPGLLSSFSYASTFDKQSQFSLGLSYGLLGFGLENLYSGTHKYGRYSFGAALPVIKDLYLGVRFSTTSSSTTALSGFHSWDVGLQYRAFRFLSFGLLANQLNQTEVAGQRTPSQYIAGLTVRPTDFLDLAFDVDTTSQNFGKHYTYQATAGVEALKGLHLTAGYHSENRIQVGFHFDLGRASLYSVTQPSPKELSKSGTSRFVLGFSTTQSPQRSVATPPSALVIKLDGNLDEEGNPGNFFTNARPSLFGILHTLKESANDSTIRKIVVVIESFPLGLAAAQEIFEALIQLRESGKRVEALLSSGRTKEYLIASAAHHISMEPSAELSLLGPRSERYYAKGTLDKIGIEGEFLARGEYKSAPETFTRKEGSQKTREATNQNLQKVEEELLKLFKRSRGWQKGEWDKLTRHAIFSSEDAVEFKLIDKVQGKTEFIEKLRKENFVRYGTHYQSNELAIPPRIAVITAQGDILQKRVRILSLTGQNQLTPEKLALQIQRAVSDPYTKAIVLRVSSPGGEVLASHQIASLIENAKKKMPVYISMGDMAASGGYMISAPASKIYADSLTLTGSIGVYLGKVNLGGLYHKLDLNKEIIGRGPFVGIDTESRAWTAAERGIMNRRLNQYYESFVGYVAAHRNISKELVEKAAKGRVWLGAESLELKIIDKQAGLLETISDAAKAAQLPANYEIYQLHEELGLVESLSQNGLMASNAGADLASEWASILLSPSAIRDLRWIVSLRESPFLYLASETRLE